MAFYRDGDVNFPRRAHAIWFLSQYRRLGLLGADPDYKGLADEILLQDVYKKVAASQQITVPDDDMKPFVVKLDAATFDPAKPQLEVKRA
jgi:nitrate/nitrite transport system substrate-binding protein